MDEKGGDEPRFLRFVVVWWSPKTASVSGNNAIINSDGCTFLSTELHICIGRHLPNIIMKTKPTENMYELNKRDGNFVKVY